MRLKSYLKENWGAPLVIGFMFLLVASAVELSAGHSDAANTIAVYAFYFLVLGVALQIASYVKYGEGRPESSAPAPPAPAGRRRPRVARKVVAIAIVVIVAGVLVVSLYPPLWQTVTPYLGPHLTIHPGTPSILREPNGTTIVVLAVGAQGGSPPYTFTCIWADGVQQSSSTGIFQRGFTSNQTLPAYADVTAKSADGLTGSARVTIQS